MQCFIVGPDRDEGQGRALVALAGRLGYPTAVCESLQALETDARFARAGRSLILVAQTAIAPTPIERLVGFAREHHGRAFVVYVADTLDPEAYKQLVRSGSADWIRWKEGEQDGEAELRELTARLLGPETTERSAKIVSFLPSKGGVGNTTLAVEAAVHLAARRKRGRRVALLDLNLQGGTVADALDIEPRFDIAEIAGHPERLDEQLVDVFTSRYGQRLDVFASPTRTIGPDEVGPQIIFTFIDLISSRYDAILLDLPTYWLPWTDNLLQGSDAVVVAGGANIPALRKLSARLAHLTQVGVPDDRVAAVVNQAEIDLLGRVGRRAEIDRVLSGRRTFFVRRASPSVDEGCDVGRPLMELMPTTRVVRDIRRLADWIETVVGPSDSPAAEAKIRQGAPA